MYKFKVGDKVVRTVESPAFRLIQGVKEYYIVTDVGTGGYWLQLDGVRDKEDPRPWYWNNFELYQEPGDDELPPVPDSVSYLKENGRRKLVARINGDLVNVLLSLSYHNITDAVGYSMEPDAALQLAYDLNRMANEIKRKQKSKP